jgi:hypothetical protein
MRFFGLIFFSILVLTLAAQGSERSMLVAKSVAHPSNLLADQHNSNGAEAHCSEEFNSRYNAVAFEAASFRNSVVERNQNDIFRAASSLSNACDAFLSNHENTICQSEVLFENKVIHSEDSRPACVKIKKLLAKSE